MTRIQFLICNIINALCGSRFIYSNSNGSLEALGDFATWRRYRRGMSVSGLRPEWPLYSLTGWTMDKQAMKDEVHFKNYRSYLKAGSLFSTPKKSSNGPRDERPTSAFIAGPQRPFLQLPAPVSPSSTAFNQWAKMSRLLHIGSTRSSFERKACFQSPLQILVDSLFSRHERDTLFSSQTEMQKLKCAACYKVHVCACVWQHSTADKMWQDGYDPKLTPGMLIFLFLKPLKGFLWFTSYISWAWNGLLYSRQKTPTPPPL